MTKNDAENEPGIGDLVVKFDQLMKKIDDLYHLQKLQFIQPDFILDFVYQDTEVKLYIPNAETDFIQRHILRGNTFYEHQLLQKLKVLNHITENSVVYDIGANIGNHTVFFSKILKAKQVVSFEPQKYCFKLLTKNIEINDLQNTTAINSMVGNKDGSGEIAVHTARNLGSTVFAPSDEGDFNMVSLDSYVQSAGEGKIDFIKIDVEGMQMSLFEGAKQVLGDMRPILWVELREFKNEFEEAAAHLKTYGYKPERLGNHDYIFTPT